MMSVERMKLRIATERLRAAGDADALARQATWLLDTLDTLHARGGARGPTNYAVMIPGEHHRWWESETGSKDYCVGYATAYVEGDDSRGALHALVVCGTFVLWPEARYGEELPADTRQWNWFPENK